MPELETLMTEKELCERLGLTRMTLYRWRRRGKLRFYRLGQKVRYSPSQIAELLHDCEQRAARPQAA